MADNNGVQAWLDDALCRDPLYDPEWWFADTANHRDRARAMQVCGMCPVRVPCLELSSNYPEGIWGGLEPQQRHQLRKAN